MKHNETHHQASVRTSSSAIRGRGPIVARSLRQPKTIHRSWWHLVPSAGWNSLHKLLMQVEHEDKVNGHLWASPKPQAHEILLGDLLGPYPTWVLWTATPCTSEPYERWSKILSHSTTMRPSFSHALIAAPKETWLGITALPAMSSSKWSAKCQCCESDPSALMAALKVMTSGVSCWCVMRSSKSRTPANWTWSTNHEHHDVTDDFPQPLTCSHAQPQMVFFSPQNLETASMYTAWRTCGVFNDISQESEETPHWSTSLTTVKQCPCHPFCVAKPSMLSLPSISRFTGHDGGAETNLISDVHIALDIPRFNCPMMGNPMQSATVWYSHWSFLIIFGQSWILTSLKQWTKLLADATAKSSLYLWVICIPQNQTQIKKQCIGHVFPINLFIWHPDPNSVNSTNSWPGCRHSAWGW